MERNILIVDDDQHFSEAMRFLLGSESYHTVWARDANEALTTLEHGNFHLVLTDLRMPGMDGFEMMDAVHRKFPFLSVIVISAYGNADTAYRAYTDGAFAFINKPFEADYLHELVSRTLSLNHPPTGEERRHYRRVPVTLPVEINHVDARMINLSAGGMQLITRNRLNLFEVRPVRIRLPEEEPVDCLLQVVRLERPNEHERKFAMAACRLRRVAPSDRRRLTDFVKKVETIHLTGTMEGGGVN